MATQSRKVSVSSALTSTQPVGADPPLAPSMAVISARAFHRAHAAYLDAALASPSHALSPTSPPQLAGDVYANAAFAGAVAAGVATALTFAAPFHASDLAGDVYADAIVARAVAATLTVDAPHPLTSSLAGDVNADAFVARAVAVALTGAAPPLASPLAGVAYANGTIATGGATTTAVVAAPPLRASALAEIQRAFSIPYMRSLSSRFIDNLGDALYFVGSNDGSVTSLLKPFGFGMMGYNINKQYDPDKPITSADHPKLVIFAVVFAMLCYIGLMKPTSRLAKQITGGAVLYGIVSMLWIPLSVVPIEWKAVFVPVCAAVLYCLKRMTT